MQAAYVAALRDLGAAAGVVGAPGPTGTIFLGGDEYGRRGLAEAEIAILEAAGNRAPAGWQSVAVLCHPGDTGSDGGALSGLSGSVLDSCCLVIARGAEAREWCRVSLRNCVASTGSQLTDCTLEHCLIAGTRP